MRLYKRPNPSEKGQLGGQLTQKLDAVAFDADDTLWHNERFFQLTQDYFKGLLADYASPGDLSERLLAAERRNLGRYGYGIKGFMLSMIECALEVTDSRVPGTVIAEIIDAGQELLPHAEAAVRAAAETHIVMLITKGDLLDQERKLAASGLGEMFSAVEIVSEKDVGTYAEIFARHGHAPDRMLMAGNSLKSDVRPVLDAGGWGIYVPHGQAWALEYAEPPEGHPRYREIVDLSGLATVLHEIEGN